MVTKFEIIKTQNTYKSLPNSHNKSTQYLKGRQGSKKNHLQGPNEGR
jgi:hypothetical protein